MHDDVVILVAAVLIGGVVAQWIGWRFRVPAILLLLVGGLVAGPVTGVLKPDKIFGDLLFPSVSLAVAVILFEGALGLGWKGLRIGGSTLWRLLSIGALTTLVGTALAAHWLLDVPWGLSLLLAAMLVVTGPTVVGPIVRTIGLEGRVATILEAEGTLIDPIGAVLTVLVFQAVFESTGGSSSIAVGIVATLGAGSLVGLIAAGIVVALLAFYVVPDQLHNVMTLAIVAGALAAANALRAESGLVAVTVMGIALATQSIAPVYRVLEFNETLRILFISGLFVILAARVDRETLASIEWRNLAFLAAIILLIRPASVAVSTIRSDLTRSERLFLAATAPRGIVAASVASVFSLRLAEIGVDQAQLMLSATLTVIIGTVLLSGFFSRRLATRLGLLETDRTVIVVLGANEMARRFATALEQHGAEVNLVDLDRRELAAARMSGLATHHGSVFADSTWENAGLQHAASFIAMTSNDELNTLAARHAAAVLGRKRVYQLPPGRPEHDQWWKLPAGVFARPLFGRDTNFAVLAERIAEGWQITSTKLTERFDGEALRATRPLAIRLFTIDPKGAVEICATDTTHKPRPGDTVVALSRRLNDD